MIYKQLVTKVTSKEIFVFARRLIMVYSALLLVVPSGLLRATDSFNFSVKAKSAIVINADTGALLYGKNIDQPAYPASITKVATALYALKHIDDLDVMITGTQESIGAISTEQKKRLNYARPAYWLEFGSSHMGIKNGEKLSLRTLFYGMLLSSANDAANLIAEHVGGTIPAFMEELNLFLRDEVGCKNTTFYNPHGLFFPGHKTTAYDMALIAREALKDPFFREVVATTKYRRPATNKQEAAWLPSFNRLLKKNDIYYYPYAFGIKTGYCAEAQNTLIAGAEKDGRRVILVLLYYDQRGEMFHDAAALFETIFNEKKVEQRVLKKGIQETTLRLKNASKDLIVFIDEDVIIESYPSEKRELKAFMVWEENLSAPIKEGERVGEVVIVDVQNDTPIRTIPVMAANAIKVSLYQKLKNLF